MTESKPKKATTVKCVAKRNLATSKGNIKAGQEFTCTQKEYDILKERGAV